MEQETLNDIYFEYLLGNINRDKLESIIFAYLTNNKKKTCIRHWKQDQYEDFISCFYPSINKIIDSYKNTGASFEAYLYKYLLVCAKEYETRKTTNEVIEYATWSARVPDMYVYEEPPVYNIKHTKYALTEIITGTKGRKNTRRLLALVLKCYYYVSDDFAEKIAALIGIESKELIGMLNKIRKIRCYKDDEIYFFKERIHSTFYRCVSYEKRISLLKENSLEYEKMYKRLDSARRRLERMRERMKKIRTEATNQQIAEVIGISKGTVDASLHRLKAKWEEMSKKANLN
jgi:GH18 family chitinase